MNKTELIESIASNADITKAAAGRALDAVTGTIVSELYRGGTVTIQGFGTFEATKRAARKGVNPSTGAAIEISARKSPKFKPGKSFKDALN